MNKNTKFSLIAALLIFALAFGAFAPAVQAAGYEAVVNTNTDNGDDDDAGTIVEVALAANAATGEFSILIAALQAADPAVLETLSGTAQYTVFAPTDAAFGDLLAELNVTAEQLLGDQALLTQVLLYHVAKGNLDSEDVLENDKIKTLQGGYIYQEGGILTDENGRTVNLVAVDIEASNGVIHVIDRVLLPSSDPQPPAEDDDPGTIVEVALAANAATGEFSILIAALQAADPAVLETLSGTAQYTVFAPTDAAFGDLLAELNVTAEQLLGDQALLTQVLLYHVAKGNLDSDDVLENDKIATLQGGYIYQDNGILTDENGRTVNLVAVDIEASNGVIHVIDRVLLPSSDPKPPADDDDIVAPADATGVYRPGNGALYLKNSNSTGFANVAINYGISGDYPVTGDWNGDGTDTIGIYRDGTFHLRNANTIGTADLMFAFGQPGDQPIAGDWDGDGFDTIGVYRSSTGQFLLRNSNTAGPAEISFYLGNVGDVGIAGDWNGDGTDSTGVFRPSNGVTYLKNTHITGFADIAFNYGSPGDQPVVGDWNNDGTDTIGIYRNGSFYLRNSNTVGFADIVFALGNPGDMPIAGDWNGLP
jgi:uncharacterized surface protein with fasciclin (FAS1) repeats